MTGRADARDTGAIELVLFDIGGVLGTNGWGRGERARAVREFGLQGEIFEGRHLDMVGTWEEGRITLDEYLHMAVFYEPRPFTRRAFTDFMLAQSVPDEGSIGLARALARSGKYRLMTLNNESAELNRYRIDMFGLRDIFSTFFSSCYLGVRKPVSDLYRRALQLTQAEPQRIVFLDDRVQNLTPARELGMHVVHFTGVDDARERLAELGVVVGR